MIAMLEDLILFFIAGVIQCVITAIAAVLATAEIVRDRFRNEEI